MHNYDASTLAALIVDACRRHVRVCRYRGRSFRRHCRAGQYALVKVASHALNCNHRVRRRVRVRSLPLDFRGRDRVRRLQLSRAFRDDRVKTVKSVVAYGSFFRVRARCNGSAINAHVCKSGSFSRVESVTSAERRFSRDRV